MLRPRWLRSTLLLLAVAMAAPACAGNPRLQRMKTPAGGVVLAPDLSVGYALSGHLAVGNTRQIEGLGTFNQNIECDFDAVVVAKHEASGGAVILATFANVVLDWDLPPSAELSSEEFVKLGGATLESLRLQFVVGPDGAVRSLPAAPSETTPEIRRAIETIIGAMESAYFGTPPTRLEKGERWSRTVIDVRPGDDRTQGLLEATFEGLFHHKIRDEDVAKIAFTRDVTRSVQTEYGARNLRWETSGVAYFALAGYPAAFDAEQRFFDPSEGITVSKVRIVWERRKDEPAVVAPAPAPDPAPVPCVDADGQTAPCPDRVQDITDPCDPDYVGPQTCEQRPPPSQPVPLEPSDPPLPSEGDGTPEDPEAPAASDEPEDPEPGTSEAEDG